jgi:hypothetical protein
MGPSRRSKRSSVLPALLLLALPAFALDLPVGTAIEVRLKTKVSTRSSQPKDPLEAMVIAPVMAGEQFAIPAGAMVHGILEKAVQSAKGDERSVLVLQFTDLEIAGKKIKIAAQVSAVDNARESVDEQGGITGILAS